MCDEAKLKTWANEALNRRQFGVLAGAAAMTTACNNVVPAPTAAMLESGIVQTKVSFGTDAGTMDGEFFHPATGKHPAVILWPDIAGIRDSKRQMAMRLAGDGHAVLVLNPYYRDVAGEQWADFASFIADGGFQKVRPWRARHTADAIGIDARAAVQWLDAQDAVDADRGVGVQGYCMGGPLTVWSAAAVPDRIKGAASFHGGGLVRPDDAMSPHRTLDRATAAFLIAVAQDDDAEAPADKTVFADAAKAAGRTAKVKVYAGDHGWCVPDSPAYVQGPADEASADLLALYSANL